MRSPPLIFNNIILLALVAHDAEMNPKTEFI